MRDRHAITLGQTVHSDDRATRGGLRSGVVVAEPLR
jgi:hypothetical protein